MTPEGKFEKALIDALHGRGAFAHHVDMIGADGFPDILVLKDERCALIECKYNTMRLRVEQAAFHVYLHSKPNFSRIFTAVKWADGTYSLQPFHGDGMESATLSRIVDRIMESLGG